MSETARLPMTRSRGRPLKMAQYLTATDRLSETVDAYRAERVSEPSPVPTKPEQGRPPPLTTLTEIPGYPLGPCRPEVETPTYGSREAAIDASRKMKRRANGTAILDPIGPPELRKRDTMSGATDTRGITSKHR